MICLAAQKRRSPNDSPVVSEAETRFLQTGLSISSARIRAESKLSQRHSHPCIQMLESASVRQELFLMLGLRDRGAIANRPSVTVSERSMCMRQ
jgi:hypothetical protein